MVSEQFREEFITKAVALFSGGLDSLLAVKLMIEQGIDVYALHFVLPFSAQDPKAYSGSGLQKGLHALGNVPLKIQPLGDDFLQMIRSARYGYGKGINPCIDCRIFTLKKAAEYMEEIGASFLITGEVLGQRPMSQHGRALKIVEKHSGMKGLILRPLSAHLLQPSIPETEGWVDRERLLAFSGRNRKPQISLAREKGITDFPSPAGGCILTYKSFGIRLKDYFDHVENPKSSDMPLLRIGRHFRTESGEKIIVAKDGLEGEKLLEIASAEDHVLEPQDFSAPVVILQGDSINLAFNMMLQFTNKDIPDDAVIIHRFKNLEEKVSVQSLGKNVYDSEMVRI